MVASAQLILIIRKHSDDECQTFSKRTLPVLPAENAAGSAANTARALKAYLRFRVAMKHYAGIDLPDKWRPFLAIWSMRLCGQRDFTIYCKSTWAVAGTAQIS